MAEEPRPVKQVFPLDRDGSCLSLIVASFHCVALHSFVCSRLLNKRLSVVSPSVLPAHGCQALVRRKRLRQAQLKTLPEFPLGVQPPGVYLI